MIKQLSSSSILCNQIDIFICLNYLVQLHNIWMSNFPHYFYFTMKPITISLIFYLTFIYYFHCNFLICWQMISNTYFTKCSSSNIHTQNKILQDSFCFFRLSFHFFLFCLFIVIIALKCLSFVAVYDSFFCALKVFSIGKRRCKRIVRHCSKLQQFKFCLILQTLYQISEISEMDPNKYTLYTYFRSSTSWRVRIALNHKGIPYEPKFIHLVKGQQKDPQYKKINPNGAVPSLVLVDGSVIIESVAIIQYLDEVHPENPLYPKDPIKKAKVRAFCQVINSGLHPYQNLRVLEKIATDYNGDKIQWAKYWVVRGMQTIEAMLKESAGNYCFGDQLTAADLFFVPHVQGGSTRFNVSLQDYPTIKKILQNLQKIEAFIQAEPKNQPDFEK